MAEDMKEQFSIGVKPTRNSLEKRLVVPHMFEHLHRHHAVKPLIDRKFTHICGDHRYILAPELGRLLIDERFLTRGVTHGNDLAVWKLLRHCERQRAPPATQLQNRMSIDKFGALYRHVQHVDFG